LIDEGCGHAGQELVAHVAYHPTAAGAEQAVIGTVGRGVIQPDAHHDVRAPDLLDDIAHSFVVSFSAMSSRKSFFDTLPTAVVGKRSTTSSRSGSLNFAMRRSSRNRFSASRLSVSPGFRTA